MDRFAPFRTNRTDASNKHFEAYISIEIAQEEYSLSYFRPMVAFTNNNSRNVFQKAAHVVPVKDPREF